MAFDPFGDFEQRGYLRNHAGEKDPSIVKKLEHNSFSRNVNRALENLENKSSITFQDVKDTHKILFADMYPWAGQSRDQNAAHLGISKGPVSFQPAPFVERGVDYALQSGNNPEVFKNNIGTVIGELAYAHPFLDGNGRTITTVVDALASKANIHVKWEETNKVDYLNALTKEIAEPNKGHLTNYLSPHIGEGRRSLEDIAKTLSVLPGLSRPETAASEISTLDGQNQPTLFLLAGPNGAGKSTLTAKGTFGDTKVIDPDAIQRNLPDDQKGDSLLAFREAVQQQRQAILNKESFVTETTLAGRNGLQLMDAAKEAGFKIELHFVGLENVLQSHQRVSNRVQAGGHSIPPETIDRRFQKVFEHLPEAMSKADYTTLYDNSENDRLRKVAGLNKEQVTFVKDTPQWAAQAVLSSAERDIQNATNEKQINDALARSEQATKVHSLTNKTVENTAQLSKQNEARNLQNRPSRGLSNNDGYSL